MYVFYLCDYGYEFLNLFYVKWYIFYIIKLVLVKMILCCLYRDEIVVLYGKM